MSTLLKNIRWSEVRCKICKPDLYNLKTRKKLKTNIIVRTELSMNENNKRPQTKTRLNTLDVSKICYII